ncbi:MAG: hypothetical protein ACREHC_08485 [Candidatus Levyibacteriota bacterium]
MKKRTGLLVGLVIIGIAGIALWQIKRIPPKTKLPSIQKSRQLPKK